MKSAVATLAVLMLASCDAVPRDSAGALDRIRRERVVRVGVVDNPPWVRASAGAASGLEPALIEDWAARHAARVEYRAGDLDELAEALHRREIDILAAGLERKTPYKSKLALTQPYLEVQERGKKTARALAVTQGENALLLDLEQRLNAQDERSLRARLEAAR